MTTFRPALQVPVASTRPGWVGEPTAHRVASGFIGRRLVRRLLDEGHSVRVLVRSEATGSDVVFHLAAETGITADRERHELVSVRGTQAAVGRTRPWPTSDTRPSSPHAVGLDVVRQSLAARGCRGSARLMDA